MEGEPNILALFKIDQKLNKIQVLSTGNKEQHQNLKRTEIIKYIRGSPPPQFLAPYAKVFWNF